MQTIVVFLLALASLAASLAVTPVEDVSGLRLDTEISWARRAMVKPTTTTTTTTTALPETTTETATLPPNRGDYELVGGFAYYKLHLKRARWNVAWQTCVDESAHLLVLRSQAEFDALYTWGRGTQNPIPTYVFYGAHHNYVNHKFVTVFDEKLETTGYTKWGWDYSNTTFFNNIDYPTMIADISISWGNKGIFLTSQRDDYAFICKQEL